MNNMIKIFFCLTVVWIEICNADDQRVFLKKEIIEVVSTTKSDSGKRLRVHLFYKHDHREALLWSKERETLDGSIVSPNYHINILGYAELDRSLYIVYTDRDWIFIDKFYGIGIWQAVNTEALHRGPVPLFLSPPMAEISSNDNGNIEVKLIETGAIPTHPRKEVKFTLDYEKKFILKSEKSESITPPPAAWEKEDTKENPFWP